MGKDTIIVESTEEAESVVIWLHGLGADGHDFEPLVPALQLPNTRFIFPQCASFVSDYKRRHGNALLV